MVQLTTLAALIAAAATSVNAYTLYAWDGNLYTGYQVKFSNGGSHPLGFYAKSYKWETSVTENCCINFCNGSKSTGGYCSSHSNSQVASANQFNKVVLGCGSTIINC